MTTTNTDPNRDIDINVPVMVRVEGEGALEFTARDGKVEQLHLKIFEPPRLFEKFLEGQEYSEVSAIAARVCGICPIAYQMTSTIAIEKVFQVDPGPWVHDMRRVMYAGEWLQSHALHIHLLATPDFLGFDNAINMAEHHPETVKRGMRLQGLGNDLLKLLGGRSVHPIGLRIGGFHRAPAISEINEMVDKLEAALEDCKGLVEWTAQLALPEDEQDFASVAIYHPKEYGINEGRLISDHGLNLTFEDYPAHFREHQVPHSTAYYSLLDGKSYFLGPLARVNLNFHQLPEEIRELVADCNKKFPSKNMFDNVLARAIECYYSVWESLRILKQYQLPKSPFVEYTPRAGIGHHCTEAPRGMIYHRFEINDDGRVAAATMIPPTSQNQQRIEDNLKTSVERLGLDHEDDELRKHCEMIIRNYDPCISCSTHFLDLKVHRE
ncbi:MAG: Ni/Fe hydrogenase subunit alpha [Kangiellaceae bacterium]|jgi:coenzyme F420-reducing hydrogenase alpha subunit|nr:Ni/Fe hydrogenase subunit alpha [Kangiellaceae bacterium]|tara:strand:+ start:17733 stop:19046 length:1314 start_codon:yes stop_codon:yes gene_type:complete